MIIPTAYDKFIEIVGDFAFKIKNLLSTILGWGFLMMSYLITVFGEKAMLIHWVFLALAIDLLFGCWSAIKRKKFHISMALYSTAVKVVMYIAIFYMPMILEKIVGDKSISMGTILVTSLLCAAEFFSACAHMLIIKPDLIGIRLFKRFLSAEMAKKLGMTVEEFEQEMKSKNTTNE